MFKENYYKALPEFIITALFGEPRFYGYNTFHAADDYTSKQGKRQDIYNLLAGVVSNYSEVDTQYHGRFITLKHNFKYLNGVKELFFSRYKHLHKIDRMIEPNNFIDAGLTIGKMGNTGYCKTLDPKFNQWRFLTEKEKNDESCNKGVHLHFEFFQNATEETKLLRELRKRKIITGLELDYFFRRGRLYINPDRIVDYVRQLIEENNA